MQSGILTILLCLAGGEAVHRLLDLPVTGNVLGMALFVLVLSARGRPLPGEEAASATLMRFLPLLFVPAGVGVVQYLALLRREFLPVAAALLASTLLTMAGCGLAVQAVGRWRRSARQARPADAGCERRA